MAAVFLLQGQINRRVRVFRERRRPLDEFCDQEVVERFRLPREGILDLIDLVKDDISPMANRSNPLDASTKTLITLRFLAKGNFFSELGDLHGVSRSSVCRSIASVVTAINANLNNIKFPTTNVEFRNTKHNFFKIASVPNVIGAIDGTLVPIIAPTGADEPLFVCRKGFHSLNVQAIVNWDLRFTDVVAKWPGSTHDATILQNCGVKPFLEDGLHGWLVGDSGYPNRSYLITPKPNPSNQQEERFNLAHSRTRMVVERAFGLLKSRFRCLHKTGGCLPFGPRKSAEVTTACMRLHNMCIEYGYAPPADILNIQDDGNNHRYAGEVNAQGNAIRQRLISRF